MNKKTIVGIIIALGLVVALGAVAFAGPGYGRGYGRSGYGPGYMMGYGPGAGSGIGGAQIDPKLYEESVKLGNELYQKRMELNAVLSASEIDEAKAKALQSEINELRNKLSEQRLAADLELRKQYPNSGQGYGPGYGMGYGPRAGMGYGPGAGMGYGRGAGPGYGPGAGMGYGRGAGPGYCWR